MWPLERLVAWLAALAVLAPTLAFACIGAFTLLVRTPGERVVARTVTGALATSALAALAVFAHAMLTPHGFVAVHLGDWVATERYTLPLVLLVDRLSATMMLLVTLIVLVVGRFSVAYLHRDPGFTRFFLLLALFSTGMLGLVCAGTIDLLFAGWELVGATSVLLIAFFHVRAPPARAAVRVYVTYRLCDVGLLAGVVLMHELAHTSSFEAVLGGEPWPGTHARISGASANALALCLLLAAMGKSAQLPFGTWLPRAMEGPTPSSALFYGALSVHAGVYLLLRAAPLISGATLARVVIVLVGALTALYGTLVARVQADVKSALAHATMSQVGAMLVEIGLGFYTFALVHLFAHASLRCLQLLRAPSALRDAHDIRAAHAGAPQLRLGIASRIFPASFVRALYFRALARFELEALQARFVASPLVRAGAFLDALERRFVARVAGLPSEREEPSL